MSIEYLTLQEKEPFMISNNKFVKYITLDSHDEVYAFINEGTPIISNDSNWRISVDKLVAYKDDNLKDYQPRKEAGAYRNVYAHSIKTLIPYEIPKEKWAEFIEKYIHMISVQFKKLLFIYKLSSSNKANYVTIIFFTRYVFKRETKINDTYNQDYYYDSKSGQRCSQYLFYDVDGNQLKKKQKGCVIKDNPSAVLKAKKGSVKTAEDGSAITKKRSVKEVAERIFIFKSFNKFVQKLKNKYMKVLNNMISHVVIYKIVSRITLDEDDSKCVRKAKFLRNQKIDEINEMLKSFQDSIDNGKIYSSIDDIYKKLSKMLCEVDRLIHKEKEETEKVKIFIKTWWIKNVVDQL